MIIEDRQKKQKLLNYHYRYIVTHTHTYIYIYIYIGIILHIKYTDRNTMFKSTKTVVRKKNHYWSSQSTILVVYRSVSGQGLHSTTMPHQCFTKNYDISFNICLDNKELSL